MNESSQILTINGGSSSIKFALFDTHDLRLIVEGKINRIGMDGTYVVISDKRTGDIIKKNAGDTDATSLFVKTLEEYDLTSLAAIGHRIVHGGNIYSKPTRVSQKLIEDLELLTPLAPHHLPFEIKLIKALQVLIPDVPQFACFDTSFHFDMPRVAQLLPLPRRYDNQGLRRYGFHGLSYEHLIHELTHTYNEPVQNKRVVLAHLGSGVSLTAVENGRSIETSMGFTPTGGVPMGARTGDLDPGIFKYFTSTLGQDIEQFNQMIHFEGGLRGISETTADMEILLASQHVDVRAAEAVSFFCYHIKKYIGSLAATMGGIDVLVFTGGMGERSAEIRSRIGDGLGFLGIDIDVNMNTTGRPLISKETSTTRVYVIPANEELVIARHVESMLGNVTH